jgi:phage shock protein C
MRDATPGVPRPSPSPAPARAAGPTPRLWRSRTDRVALGVIGGLAEKLGWEAKPLRILWGLVGVLSLPLGALPAIVPYLALWGITQARGTPAPQRPLRRSRTHQVVSGLLGGVAEWLGIRPGLVRVGYVGLTAVTFVLPGIVTYLVLWAKTPLARSDSRAEPWRAGDAERSTPRE